MLPFLQGSKMLYRLCKLPMEKLVTMETHLASQQRLWNQRLEVADAEDVADDESSEILSTSSSSGNSSDGDDMPAAQNDIPGPVWRNRRSHVVHRCSQSARSTACGRLVSSSNFELLEEGCSSLNARCGKCFKGEVISSVGGLISVLDQQRAKRPRR